MCLLSICVAYLSTQRVYYILHSQSSDTIPRLLAGYLDIRVHVTKFCQENGYIWSSGLHLPGNSFTHVSESWGSTPWLDHCFATKDGNNIITIVSVDYDCHLSDHFPLNINVCCDLAPIGLRGGAATVLKKLIGESESTGHAQIHYPCGCPSADMQNMHHELVGCTDMNCHNRNHIAGIEKYYIVYNDNCN